MWQIFWRRHFVTQEGDRVVFFSGVRQYFLLKRLKVSLSGISDICLDFSQPIQAMLSGTMSNRLILNRHNRKGFYHVHSVRSRGAYSIYWLWVALIAADQTKWTPARNKAPVCLKWSRQSEHTANKWMHSLRAGSASPSRSLLSLLCSLWVI